VPWGAFATETLASPEGEELPVGVASFEQSATVLFEAPLREVVGDRRYGIRPRWFERDMAAAASADGQERADRPTSPQAFPNRTNSE
jgi:hypothetical protein